MKDDLTKDDSFYPATRFTSWPEFFGFGANAHQIYKHYHHHTAAASSPSSASFGGVAAAGVTNLHRMEMAFYIILVFGGVYNFLHRLYHISRSLDDIVGAGRYHLELEAPRFTLSFLFGSLLENLLAPGIDVADHQLRNFERNMGLLIGAFVVYIGISQGARRFFNVAKHTSFVIYAVMGGCFAVYVHGWGSMMLGAILGAHFLFTVHGARKLPRWLFLTILWLSLVALLLAAEWNHGFVIFLTGRHWRGNLKVGTGLLPEALLALFPKVLLSWNSTYNMVLLRLIAFSGDYLEAVSAENETMMEKDGTKAERLRAEVAAKHKTRCIGCSQIAQRLNPHNLLVAEEIQPICYKARTETLRRMDEYTSFSTYVAFVLYLPLYIGGPVTSFNAFVSHVHLPQKALPKWTDIARYAFRVLALYFSLVIFNHLVYLTSIRRQVDVVRKLPLVDQSGIMYLMLAFLWLKFSVIWKFFRLVALCDGVEAPEDMNRCFSNCTSVAGFWRDWHASFNLWIVRYMYVPLGGSRHKMLVVFPIFLFMALWHDTALELLSWALIMCFTTALELIVTAYCGKIKFWKTLYCYRYLVTAAASLSVFSLIAANVIGFGVGMAAHSAVKDSTGVEFDNWFKALVAWICLVIPSTSISLVDKEMENNRIRKATEELKVAVENSTTSTGVGSAKNNTN